MITRYIDNLDWYLVVEKNTAKLHSYYIAQLKKDSILMVMVLADVGENVRRVVGKQGVVARWGGDEFAGILHGTQNETQALLRLMKQAICSSNLRDASGELDEYTISISVGATVVGANDSFTELIEQADQALYVSKKSGRDCITYFESILPEDGQTTETE